MYRVYNKALDDALPKYGVHSIDELTNDQLMKLAESFGLSAVPKRDEKTKVFFGMDRDQTMKTVEMYLTFSLYMGDGFWEDKHLKKVKDAEIDSRLGKMKSGDEVFEIMSRHKLGFFKLKPGTSADVDWTVRYMEEFFQKVPFFKYMDVTDLETGKLVGKPEATVEVKTESKTVEEKTDMAKALTDAVEAAEGKLEKDLKKLMFRELVELAKKQGIEKPTFKSKEMLIRLLEKK